MEFDNHLSLKVMDHIRVNADGKLAVILVTGTRVRCESLNCSELKIMSLGFLVN